VRRTNGLLGSLNGPGDVTQAAGSTRFFDFAGAKAPYTYPFALSQDPSALGELQKLKVMTTPVIVIDGAVIVGFDTEKLDAAQRGFQIDSETLIEALFFCISRSHRTSGSGPYAPPSEPKGRLIRKCPVIFAGLLHLLFMRSISTVRASTGHHRSGLRLVVDAISRR
jgi:hypothetical protein